MTRFCRAMNSRWFGGSGHDVVPAPVAAERVGVRDPVARRWLREHRGEGHECSDERKVSHRDLLLSLGVYLTGQVECQSLACSGLVAVRQSAPA